jgi:catalase
MLKQMASHIVSAADKAEEILAGQAGRKTAQLQKETKAHTEDDRITTDFGVRQGNTDDWLKVVSNDAIGPALLEDNFAREKVRHQSQTWLASTAC